MAGAQYYTETPETSVLRSVLPGLLAERSALSGVMGDVDDVVDTVRADSGLMPLLLDETDESGLSAFGLLTCGLAVLGLGTRVDGVDACALLCMSS